ncbi:hypothetical protein MFRU_054g00250 [Monilinia fructicola]|uniref:CN hydrolase domain-containing protein n=1 Tax=Monilinia fructicola TaxID=38448 RepID=A0A5M9JFR2_MONFR|nr:hypothetical protein EYC84_009889 [Monilinia fructicola]KAG4025596.1 hypothetical protein MFRU_054g00250 [Monilinia fructicola]
MDRPSNPETLIAIGQLCSTSNPHQNLLTSQKLAQAASTQGAKALFLPEATDYITTPGSPPTSLSLALPISTSPFVLGLQSSAREYSIAINVGIHVPNAAGTKVFNRSIWINEHGEIVGSYDKLHLFDYAAAGLRESDGVEAGAEIVKPIETIVGRVGLLICFDLRFPEPALALRNLNTQILTYPSAFTVPTGRLHWETLLRARAIETQSYVIAAAQVGAHNEKRTSYGHSMVIDPQGRVLLDMGDEGVDGGKVGLVGIDLERVRETREKMPLLRRFDVYPEI